MDKQIAKQIDGQIDKLSDTCQKKDGSRAVDIWPNGRMTQIDK